MNEQPDPPIGGAYEEPHRKAGVPIPDFADEDFFEAFPELRALTRAQIEPLITIAASCYQIMVIPSSPSGVKHKPLDAALLVDAACRIYAAKQNMSKPRVMVLVIKIMEWLRKESWTLLNHHDGKTKGGHSIFSTMRLAVMVVPDGDSN